MPATYFGAQDRRQLPQAEQRRLSILDATLRVVADGGIDAVTHRRVAAEAGVPVGSTTYYFASRDDLIREAFRHYFAETHAFGEALAAEFEWVTADSLVEFWAELTRRQFVDRPMILAEYEILLYAARDEAFAQEFNAWERVVFAKLAEALERLGAARPMDAARLFHTVVRGFELERLTRPWITEKHLRERLRVLLPRLIEGEVGMTAREARGE